MTSRLWQWIAACALVVSACGGASNDDDSDDDGIGPYSDAGVPPNDTTRDVAGGWSWSATRVGEDAPFMACELSVGGGVFDIACPQGNVPREVPEGAPHPTGCTLLRDDLHVNGSLSLAKLGHLEGMLDHMVEYEGESCVSHGFTTGAAYPLPAFAQMSAEQVVSVELGTFLSHLGGRWDWTLAEPPGAGLACEVNLGLELIEIPGVKVSIACPTSAASPVIPGCEAQDFIAITAHLVPGKLDGELADEVHHAGATCGANYPPVVTTPRAILKARAH